jgi:hypothetical protein
VRVILPADWLSQYGLRFDEFRLPTEMAKRQAIAEPMGRDVCSPLLSWR